ncbi:MAG: alanyl-tRNA editing protein [Gammaproteobacteria bacterium]|nr:alanyl-tRNA editing protein [Gammaproteobacteria bacterium]MDH3447332.1 alanyl-tRNA editing protein [Gammaproteobacteria bacterium]
MTEKVFYQDSYQKTLRSEVVEVLDNGVILAATIFYPLGGGQPGDSGRLTIGGRHYRVVDTRYAQDRQNIIHFLEEQDLDRIHPGDPVDMEIDWVRRHRLMRMHTSMHLVCSLIDAQATGGAVGETESRLDFDLQGQVVDKEQLTAGLNALVAKAIPVSIGAITDEELERNPALVRTMSVQPPRGQGSVRTVSIENTDYQPCGGTHVRNTAEIGRLIVTGLKNKGRQNKRITLALVEP